MQKVQNMYGRQINAHQTSSKHNCIFQIHSVYFVNI